jgi:rubrerythrin
VEKKMSFTPILYPQDPPNELNEFELSKTPTMIYSPVIHPKDSFEITSDSQLVRVLQGAIADEHSASSLYSQIIESTDNEEVKKVLTEIMNDEIQHIWRLTDLVMLLDKNWETQLKAAEKEGENE